MQRAIYRARGMEKVAGVHKRRVHVQINKTTNSGRVKHTLFHISVCYDAEATLHISSALSRKINTNCIMQFIYNIAFACERVCDVCAFYGDYSCSYTAINHHRSNENRPQIGCVKI
jgi:hypothetical protein